MALSALIVWEVRTAGADTNGGGFKAGASGTDWTQQDAAQYSVTDGVANGTTTLTSATANFGTDVVGNVIYVQGGTGSITAGWYEITSRTNATTIVVDRSTGLTAGTGVTLKIGGALATVTQAATNHVGQNTVHVKNGSYTITTTITPLAGASGAPTRWLGYNATRGDLDSVNDFSNFPTITVNNAAIVVFTLNNSYQRVRNFILSGGVGASKGTRGVSAGSNYISVENCKATAFSAYGFIDTNGNAQFRRCWATAQQSGATAGFGASAAGNSHFVGCYASANPCPGFNAASCKALFYNCIADSNTGASSDGFLCSGTFGATILQSVAYNNGRDGIRYDGGNSADIPQAYGNILVSNAGYGMRSASTTWADLAVDYNAFYNNTSGARNGVPTGAHDVTLTGVPFTNAGSGDFSLDNTASEGAACRAAGFPGAFPGGLTTGYIDIGAAQHQDAGGAAGMLYRTGGG